jgi:hypothetical protein
MAKKELTAKQKREKNIALINGRLDRELKRGSEYMDYKVAHMYSGVFGMIVNPLVSLIYKFAARESIIKRAQRQLDLIVSCASKYNGKNLDALVDEHLEEYLNTEEAYVRGNRNHKKFPEVKKILRSAFRARLAAVTEILDGEGETYDDLARSVFPKREQSEKLCNEQLEIAEKLIVMLDEEKDLVRIPSLIRKEVLTMLRSGFEWYKKTLKEELEEMYG